MDSYLILSQILEGQLVRYGGVERGNMRTRILIAEEMALRILLRALLTLYFHLNYKFCNGCDIEGIQNGMIGGMEENQDGLGVISWLQVENRDDFVLEVEMS